MSANALTSALGGRWYGSYGTARCPAHDDHNPSLQLGDGDTAILLKCYAGCDTRDIIDALRARGLWHDGGDAQELYSKRTYIPLQAHHDQRRKKMLLRFGAAP